MKIQPIGRQVCIRKKLIEQSTKSGLFIPKDEEHTIVGEVFATADELSSMLNKRVVFDEFAAKDVSDLFDDKDYIYLLVDWNDVLAVLH